MFYRRISQLLVFAMLLPACSDSLTGSRTPFVDATETSGLDFVHANGADGEYLFPEIQGPGVALFDYDNDGDLDVYLVQGASIDTATGAIVPAGAGGRLLRNDLAHEDGENVLRFVDVTDQSGLHPEGYGMGATVADYDNDGDVDLYLTHFGNNQLWRNDGDGRFVDVSEVSETNDPRWSHSATFLDYDRDGWLDLFVVNYVDFSLGNRKTCPDATGAIDYCGPLTHAPQADRLYHNLGNGRFEDVSSRGGITALASGLGVASIDINSDGWPDIYVANDAMPNQLWVNQGGDRFVDEALIRGSAVNSQGQPEASMGIVAGDIDGDGDEDLFMTHLREETNTLYLNDGDGGFSDKSIQTGLAAPSRGNTGFGSVLFDYDLDGWLDIAVANGAVRAVQSESQRGLPFPYGQANQLFHNDGGSYSEATVSVPAFAQEGSSRGLATGDLDNDGDPDLVVANDNGATQLLLNTEHGAHWLGIRLLGREGRDVPGAMAVLTPPNGRARARRIRVDGSYLSANDPRVVFGLGDQREAGQLVVTWPDGTQETWDDLEIDRYHTLSRGASGLAGS